MNVHIRSEAPRDIAAIENLIANAFRSARHTSHTEQYIVRALRLAGALTLSLVAETDAAVVGHVAVSPVAISDGALGWYGLGPIAVAPEFQGRGIGSTLMRRALADLRALGARGCVLLGDPEYYSRFGFKADAALVLRDVPPQYFQSLAFSTPVPSGTVTYHEAFNARA